MTKKRPLGINLLLLWAFISGIMGILEGFHGILSKNFPVNSLSNLQSLIITQAQFGNTDWYRTVYYYFLAGFHGIEIICAIGILYRALWGRSWLVFLYIFQPFALTIFRLIGLPAYPLNSLLPLFTILWYFQRPDAVDYFEDEPFFPEILKREVTVSSTQIHLDLGLVLAAVGLEFLLFLYSFAAYIISTITFWLSSK